MYSWRRFKSAGIMTWPPAPVIREKSQFRAQMILCH
jgi:hypothetical protein